MENQKQPELFGLTAMDLRSPKPFWLRTAAKLNNVLAELELELKRMKEKNLPPEMIAAKNLQIDELVEFYNATEATIQSYEMLIKFYTLNNKINERLFGQDEKKTA
jgi:hypothetical protein